MGTSSSGRLGPGPVVVAASSDNSQSAPGTTDPPQEPFHLCVVPTNGLGALCFVHLQTWTVADLELQLTWGEWGSQARCSSPRDQKGTLPTACNQDGKRGCLPAPEMGEHSTLLQSMLSVWPARSLGHGGISLLSCVLSYFTSTLLFLACPCWQACASSWIRHCQTLSSVKQPVPGRWQTPRGTGSTGTAPRL